MTPASTTVTSSTRVVHTYIPDSWAWMRTDLLARIAPFVIAYAITYSVLSRPAAFGLSFGRPGVQLLFGAVAAPFLFFASAVVQLWLTPRRPPFTPPPTDRQAAFQPSSLPL